MKLQADKKRTLIHFVIADLVFAVALFLSCIKLFLTPDWSAVQIVLIAVFVFFSVFMLVISLTRNYYVVESKFLVAVRGTRQAIYNYEDVVYIDKEQSEKKRVLSFCTNKGVVRYLPFDKEGKIYTTFVNKCHNLLEYDEFKKRFPKVKI